MSPRESRLRALCFFYELSGKSEVASALQDAADGVREGSLSPRAADVLCDVWRPLVGLEAAVRALPMAVDQRAAVQYAVNDLRRMLKEAPDAQKPRLAALLREQVEILREMEGGPA